MTSFSKLEILDAILSVTKVRIFLIPLSIAFSNPTILGFLFSIKKKIIIIIIIIKTAQPGD